MQRIALFVILLLHGLIHVMGFIKAYKPEALPQMAHGVSRGKGLVWLVSVLLFIAVAIMVLLKQQSWWWLGLIAVGVSQLLIIGNWQDAKWGTIANAIVLVAAILAWGSWSFEKKYTDDVKAGLASEHGSDTELLTEADIAHMPSPI